MLNRRRSLAALAIAALAVACATPPKPRPLRWSDVVYPYPEKVAEIAGHRIVYVDEGPRDDAEPLVLVHGWGGDLRNWRLTVRDFSPARRVVALDLPGFGKSEKRADADYRPTREADAVVELLDRLQIERAILVGNSMGGLVGAWAAIRNPERVARLVLVDAAGLQPIGWFARWIASEERLAHPVWRGDEAGASMIFVRMPPDYPDLVRERWQISQADPVWALYAKALANSLEGIGAELLVGRLDEIRVPTLVVWGEGDPLLPVRFAKEFHAGIPGSLLSIIPDCGHVPQWECPAAFGAVLANYLGIPAPAAVAAPVAPSSDDRYAHPFPAVSQQDGAHR